MNNPASSVLGIILAGGRGTRLNSDLPKPLTLVNGERLIVYVLKQLCRNQVNDQWVILGYKGDLVQRTITDEYKPVDSSLTFLSQPESYNTNERLYEALHQAKQAGFNRCVICYCDVISDVVLPNFDELAKNGLIHCLAVHPVSHYGLLSHVGDRVLFQEKAPSNDEINGGYLCVTDIERLLRFYEQGLIPKTGDFSKEVLTRLSAYGEVNCYTNCSYWLPVDNQRDLEAAENALQAKCHC